MLQNISTQSCRRVSAWSRLLAATMLLGVIPWRVAADPEQGDPLAGSPCLDQQIHIRAEGIPISDLLALISKRTGLDLTVRRDVADDKVIVFGPPRPLKAVLADLAALYNDTWLYTRTADGKDHYSLYRSTSAQDYENTLTRDIQERMMKQLDGYIDAAKSPKPYPYEAYRVAAQVLGLLSLDQKQQLLLHMNLNLPYDTLTPTEQVTAHQAVNAIYDADASDAIQRNLPYDRPPDSVLEQSGLRFQIQNTGSDPSEYQLHLFLTIGAAYNEDFATLDDRIPWLLPVHGNPYTRRPIPAAASMPDASRTAQVINTPALSWVERLRALSVQTGAPILADYYRCLPPPLPTVDPFPAENGDPGRFAMDQMAKAESALWWVRGKTLLLRRRNWYTQRLYEVPDRWVLELQKQLAAQNGVPTYGDVFKVTELTQDQMAGLRVADGPNGSSGILGEGTDETSLAGLPELLAIYKAQYASIARTPLPDVPTSEADMRRATLTYDDLPVEFRSLVSAFLQAQRNPVALAESGESFFTRLTGSNLQAGQVRSTHVSLSWTTGHYTLTLPTILTQDRRDKTEVQIIP